MKLTNVEAPDFDTAKSRAEGNAKLRGVVRLAMTVVMIVFIGLLYSLLYVAKGTAEYYVCILTLIMNIMLFVIVLCTMMVLRARYEKYEKLMKAYSEKDKPDPWKIETDK